MTGHSPRWDDEGIPEIADDATPERARVPDPQEAPLPAERPLASTDFGTTASEQRAGEGLDRKLAREQPELAPDEAADETNEADEADEDEPARDPDDPHLAMGEKKAVTDETRGEAGLSPEERAIRLEE
jgi:hypothetical protein